MKTERRTRAVIYARKSTTDDGSEQSKSITTQLKEGKAYAKQRGWVVVGEFSDDGKEGTLDRSKRKGLNAALTLIESNEADALVTLWYNRLSRDALQWFAYLDILDRHQVEWHVTAEGGLVRRETAVDKFQVNLQGLLAVLQRDTIRDNWRRAHKERIEAGLPKTTNPQFGYDYKFEVTDSGRRTGGRYVVNEAEAEVVKDLYRRYIRGDGFTTLVAWLNESGVRVKGTGNKWTVRTLNRWMDVGFPAGFISREEHLRDKKGAHTALITQDQWLAYRVERERRAPLGKGNGSAERWWLAGLVKCGECGGSTYIGGPSVCCTNHRADPTACTGGKSILRIYVENTVGWWLGGHLDRLEQLVGHESRELKSPAVAAWEAAKARVDNIDRAIGKADAERLLDGVDNASTVEHLRGLLATAKKERDKAAAALQRDESPDLDLLRNGDGWDADRRAALAGVLDRVEVYANGVTLYPVTGDGVSYLRNAMHPRCRIDGCNNRERTGGLCTSHVMRARNLGVEVLDALVERVGDDQPSVTVEEVEEFFERAR